MCIAPTQPKAYIRPNVKCVPARKWEFDGIEYNPDYAVVLTNVPQEVSFLDITEEFFSSAHIYADVEQYGDVAGTWLLSLETAVERNAALVHPWSFPTTPIVLRQFTGHS